MDSYTGGTPATPYVDNSYQTGAPQPAPGVGGPPPGASQPPGYIGPVGGPPPGASQPPGYMGPMPGYGALPQTTGLGEGYYWMQGAQQAQNNPYTGAYDPSWIAAYNQLPQAQQQYLAGRYQGWNPQNIQADFQSHGGMDWLNQLVPGGAGGGSTPTLQDQQRIGIGAGGGGPAGTTQPLPQGPQQQPQTLQEAQGGNQQPYVPGGILGGGTYYTGGPLANPQVGAGGPSGTAPQIGSSMGVTPTGQGVNLQAPGMWGGAAGPTAPGGGAPNLGLMQSLIRNLFQGGQIPQVPTNPGQGNLGLMRMMQRPGGAPGMTGMTPPAMFGGNPRPRY